MFQIGVFKNVVPWFIYFPNSAFTHYEVLIEGGGIHVPIIWRPLQPKSSTEVLHKIWSWRALLQRCACACVRYPFLELYWYFVAGARLGHLFVAGALLLLGELGDGFAFCGVFVIQAQDFGASVFCWQVQYFRECDAKTHR